MKRKTNSTSEDNMIFFFSVTDTRWNYSLSSSGWRTNIQLFRQRFSHESLKAYATMPIGIMGSKRCLIEFQDDLADKEGESMNTRVCAVSFHHAETP